ncbi:Uronate isomerase [Sedimentisphaera cyanobacteriorum]|uniref:Uronate isomerase n=1 Tax=Sedimentisphaera cyanobacteriorum TaxID=1940790 RepID=A0A1Q2HML9_9BACT|nr:glucuronate isomerase [Sedimentisphaera cyanobacteriorum]AQQ08779.1 Uronate isomerase [Sedimentisphaera cyanobacteriorum]
MDNFITDNFLLKSGSAQRLYHEFAKDMPIFDYHCHLPPKQVAEDAMFENITQAWLAGDHYKWRAMRTNGVDEKFATGSASDREKFRKWAETIPYALKSPLHHWTHLELKRYFGIDELLSPASADRIYDKASEMLRSSQYSTRNLMRMMSVKAVCTTDDPVDSLEYHKKIAEDGFEIKVLPTWRPDKAMAAEDTDKLNQWIEKLSEAADIEISDFHAYLEALKKRHSFFHQNGCRISDHGLETVFAEDYTESEIKAIFEKIRSNKELDRDEVNKFKSAMLTELAAMNHSRGWAQQLHLGAIRNNNSKMFKSLGPDTGFDSILDAELARPLSKFLDRLNTNDSLAKTIIYNLNPRDNELIGSMIGNFQDGSIPGKMQFGTAWWFLDNKSGMERQIEALSSLGLLSRFIGMLTDSRSFLSYPRHEYFRRILCNILGNDIENGIVPNHLNSLGRMVQDICFNNAENYFQIDLD